MQPRKNPQTDSAFTLIELLVVVAIIILLISMLVPAMERAMKTAQEVECASRQRVTVLAAKTYSLDNRSILPPWEVNGKFSSAYDIRAPWYAGATVSGVTPDSPKEPVQLGILSAKGYQPGSQKQMEDMLHCPTMNNSGSPYPGHCMNVVSPYGVGAGFWEEDQYYDSRVIIGYNYRAASFAQSPEGGILRGEHLNSTFIVTIDVPDTRFASTSYSHRDKYISVNGDLSAHFIRDSEHAVRTWVNRQTGGPLDGWGGDSYKDEALYNFLGPRSSVSDEELDQLNP